MRVMKGAVKKRQAIQARDSRKGRHRDREARQRKEQDMALTIKIARTSDGAFRAWCPALPGCVVRAQSHGEAQRMVNQAISGYLASLNVALPRELTRLASVG